MSPPSRTIAICPSLARRPTSSSLNRMSRTLGRLSFRARLIDRHLTDLLVREAYRAIRARLR